MLKRSILSCLAAGPKAGLEIADALGQENNGHFVEQMHELELAGFVAADRGMNPITGKRTRVAKYRIRDNYTRFYLHYIEPHKDEIANGSYHHLAQLESLRREHYLVEKNYLEMVWLHDPERALGTLQTFYAEHEDDAYVAALLVYWLAKSGQREKAFALMNRFRLPDERTAAAMLPDWMMACVPFLPEEVKTKLPEAHRRAKEIYDAIMSTWRSMNNPRRSNTRT